MSITAGSTALAADFINKAAANATPANDAGRVAKLESDGRQDAWFLKNTLSLTSYEAINGTTTPRAVTQALDGTIILAEGDVAGRRGFFGFSKTNNSGNGIPTLINSGQSTSTTYSFTTNAGNNRILVVQVNLALVGTTVAPSGVTFNAVSMTLIGSSVGSRSGIAYYWIALGSNGSNDSARNIVVSGATGFASTFAYTIGNAHQTTPIDDFDITRSSTNTLSTAIQPTTAIGLVVHGISSRTGNAITLDSKLTLQQTEGTSRVGGTGDIFYTSHTSADVTYASSGTAHDATEQLSGGTVLVKGVAPVATTVHYDGVVNGFTSLTQYADYYVANTSGDIATNGGGAHVGIAISTTEILMNRVPERDISCHVYQTTSTTLGTNFTVLDFGAELFDTDGMHSNTSNISRITFNRSGKYLVGGTVRTTGANIDAAIQIRLNGSTELAVTASPSGGSDSGGASASVLYTFNAGDYIEILGNRGADGGGSTTGNSTSNAWAVYIK